MELKLDYNHCFPGHVFTLASRLTVRNGFFCGMQPLQYSPREPGQVRRELRWVLSQGMRHSWALSILKRRQSLQSGFQSSFYLVLKGGGSYYCKDTRDLKMYTSVHILIFHLKIHKICTRENSLYFTHNARIFKYLVVLEIIQSNPIYPFWNTQAKGNANQQLNS